MCLSGQNSKPNGYNGTVVWGQGRSFLTILKKDLNSSPSGER
jgi:hypothetical protein